MRKLVFRTAMVASSFTLGAWAFSVTESHAQTGGDCPNTSCASNCHYTPGYTCSYDLDTGSCSHKRCAVT